MTSRLALFATAARNQIGRVLGVSAAYMPGQIATAKAMRDALRTRYDEETSAVCLGDVDSECSFLLMARGDETKAGGACHWWNPRRQLIKQHTGIDVWTADAADQARAMMAEMSQSWSEYRHVEATLIAAVGLQANMTVLVSQYERSGSQARDIARRTPTAELARGVRDGVSVKDQTGASHVSLGPAFNRTGLNRLKPAK